ncbi:hypothetical protein OH76DRAFT_1111480 [Lentinus brumalis]|uniref:Uncharacterized protein n=1 Tax=Lentinus brumalis TaxID=2498619 RepID=A0A371CVA9_9APHY|nr:hypothetical protein OH76DRAFT_1111480 [Polyporus brumalis]
MFLEAGEAASTDRPVTPEPHFLFQTRAAVPGSCSTASSLQGFRTLGGRAQGDHDRDLARQMYAECSREQDTRRALAVREESLVGHVARPAPPPITIESRASWLALPCCSRPLPTLAALPLSTPPLARERNTQQPEDCSQGRTERELLLVQAATLFSRRGSGAGPPVELPFGDAAAEQKPKANPRAPAFSGAHFTFCRFLVEAAIGSGDGFVRESVVRCSYIVPAVGISRVGVYSRKTATVR